MTSTKLLVRLALAVASTTAIGVVAACSSPDQAGVNARCACEGCTPSEQQNRLADAAAERQKADTLGCGGPYDSLASCRNDSSACVVGKYVTNGGACNVQEAQLCACSKELC